MIPFPNLNSKGDANAEADGCGGFDELNGVTPLFENSCFCREITGVSDEESSIIGFVLPVGGPKNAEALTGPSPFQIDPMFRLCLIGVSGVILVDS